MNARRGYVPEDEHNFSPDAIRILKRASEQVCYLLNEGYDLKQASTFVGNHFLLSERQRLAIVRSVASRKQVFQRECRKEHVSDLAEQTVWIDGFNQIITLEVMLSQGILLQCMDGSTRDLAALRGTYRIIPETDQAIRMMLEVLRDAGAENAVILLDEPVSNSGRLKVLISEVSDHYPVKPDIRIQRDVDKALYDKEHVITSDSVILDHCRSWFNLTEQCVKKTGSEVLKIW